MTADSPKSDTRFQAQDTKRFPAAIPEGPHPIPSRTRKLSPPGPMVLQGKLCGRVGRRRDYFHTREELHGSSRVFSFWGRKRVGPLTEVRQLLAKAFGNEMF